MPAYDPNTLPNGQPADQQDMPPEQSGQEVPNDPLSGGLQRAPQNEQDQADRFVMRAWQLIYSDQMFPQVLQVLTGGQTPPGGAPGGEPAGGGAPEGPSEPESQAEDTGEGGEPAGQGAEAETPPENTGEGGQEEPTQGLVENVQAGTPAPPPPDQNAPPDQAAAGGSSGDPARGLAQAADMIVTHVGDVAAQAGEQLIPDAVFHAAGDIVEELAEISRRAHIKDYSQDRNALESAWFQFLDIYRQRLASHGVLDTQHAQQDMSRLVQADKNGTLERIMRELAAEDGSGQAGGPPVPPNEAKGTKPKGFNAAMGV